MGGDSLHLLKLLGELHFHFLRKFNVPAAERAGAGLLEFAAAEIADVVSGGKNFGTAAKKVRRQALRKQ